MARGEGSEARGVWGCGAFPSAPCGDAPWPLWRCALVPVAMRLGLDGPGWGCPAKGVGAAKAVRAARWVAQRRLTQL
jgi:hypothetical protein